MLTTVPAQGPIDQQTDHSLRVLGQLSKVASDELLDALAAFEINHAEYATLPMEKFALQEKRAYPIHDLQNVILSKIYFDLHGDTLPQHLAKTAKDALDMQLNLLDVPEEWFQYPLRKTAEHPESICLLPSLGLCKVASADGVQRAGAMYRRDLHKLTLSQRVEFAQNFVKAAKHFGVREFPSEVSVYAAQLDSDLNNTKMLLDARAALAERSGRSGDVFRDLGEKVAACVSPGVGELEKLASVIHELDVEHGFDHPKYDHRIPCAYSSVFNLRKSAEDKAVSPPAGPSKADIVGKYGLGVLEEVESEEGDIDTMKLTALISSLPK